MESNKDQVSIKGQKKTKTFRAFHDVPWKLYGSRFLSAWGDHLWMFGAGVFMVELDPNNLRLVASYGLVMNISVIIFGAYIGKWIDLSKRLKAAKLFLVINNVFIALSCTLLALYFSKESKILDFTHIRWGIKFFKFVQFFANISWTMPCLKKILT